jgi:hypothetical protein
MNIYISSSWKNRDRVRNMAVRLREFGHTVYDFTDPKCRNTPEIPPEKYPEEFDPDEHIYREYINKPEWKAAVMCNKEAIEIADLIILLLPCGIDSHADWALGVGMGKKSIVVGHPKKGERSPVHLWADLFVDNDDDVYSAYIVNVECYNLSGYGPRSLLLFCRSEYEINNMREFVKMHPNPDIVADGFFFTLSADCLRYREAHKKAGIHANNIEKLVIG